MSVSFITIPVFGRYRRVCNVYGRTIFGPHLVVDQCLSDLWPDHFGSLHQLYLGHCLSDLLTRQPLVQFTDWIGASVCKLYDQTTFGPVYHLDVVDNVGSAFGFRRFHEAQWMSPVLFGHNDNTLEENYIYHTYRVDIVLVNHCYNLHCIAWLRYKF